MAAMTQEIKIKDNYTIEVISTRHEVQSCSKVGLEAHEMLPWVRVLAAKSDGLGERRELVSKKLPVKNTPLRKTALKR